MPKIKKVLCVDGQETNISIMMEMFLRQIFTADGIHNVSLSSAATNEDASENKQVDSGIAQVLLEKELLINGHRSRWIGVIPSIKEIDFIICADEASARLVREEFCTEGTAILCIKIPSLEDSIESCRNCRDAVEKAMREIFIDHFID